MWGTITGLVAILKAVALVVPQILDFWAQKRVEKKAQRLNDAIIEAQKPDQSLEETARAAQRLQREIDPRSFGS